MISSTLTRPYVLWTQHGRPHARRSSSTLTEALVAASMPMPRKLPFMEPVARSMKW